MKYSEYALIPSELTDKDPIGTVYELVTGESVTIQYICTLNNENDQCIGMLERYARELYDAPFETIRRVWLNRTGENTEYWHKVKLTKYGVQS